MGSSIALDDMPYGNFLQAKQAFFSDFKDNKFNAEIPNEPNRSIKSKQLFNIRNAANQVDYSHLMNNKFLLEQEFEHLFANLHAAHDKEAFLLYCYYCALLLKNLYTAYGQDYKVKADDFQDKLTKIKKIHKDGAYVKNPTKYNKFFSYLWDSIKKNFDELASTPFHTSKIRDKVAFANVCRIYWIFCKNSVINFLLLSKDWRWLDKIANVFGTKIDVDKIAAFLQKPNAIFRVLSVAFFGVRLLINIAMIIKHTFMPSDKERDNEKTDPNKGARFVAELYKRHCELLNDIVWAMVNLLTNYNYLFNISASVASWMTVGFLVFDFALLLWRQKLLYSDYSLKKAQYEYEKSIAKNDDEKKILDLQLSQLEISYRANFSALIFNSVAAAILVAGFSASLIFALPALILSSYVFCMIGVAMYLSADSFKAYREKSLILEECKEGSDNSQALEAYRAARNEFILTFSQNILMPSLFILTCAFCWQAALALAVVYGAYKLYEFYNGYEAQKPLASDKTPLLKDDLAQADDIPSTTGLAFA